MEDAECEEETSLIDASVLEVLNVLKKTTMLIHFDLESIE